MLEALLVAIFGAGALLMAHVNHRKALDAVLVELAESRKTLFESTRILGDAAQRAQEHARDTVGGRPIEMAREEMELNRRRFAIEEQRANMELELRQAKEERELKERALRMAMRGGPMPRVVDPEAS